MIRETPTSQDFGQCPCLTPSRIERERDCMSETEERTEEPQEKLTAKERAFVEEYLVDLNGTQAAIRAEQSKEIE